MPSSRIMRAVLHNTLGTYLSRYSDHDGYWLFGFLVPQLVDFRIDLLSRSAHADRIHARAAERAVTAFRDQLAKATFPIDRIRSANLWLRRDPTLVDLDIDGVPAKGWRLLATAEAETMSGQRFERRSEIRVAAHNPAVERRSGRPAGANSVSTARTMRGEAQALRLGLLCGCVSISDVVAWADTLVGEDRAREAPQLLGLALLRPDGVGQAVSLLGEVPGDSNPAHVGRHIASLVRSSLSLGRITERQAATALYVAMREGFSPDEDFESMAYYFDDVIDCARKGVYGGLDALRSELLEYLSRI